MRSKIIIILQFLLPIIYVLSCNRNRQKLKATRIDFPTKISVFKLFAGQPKDLIPAPGIELQEIAAELFTDYARKQRLIKLPPGTRMIVRGDGLPEYPDGTLLVKTFYYDKEDNNFLKGRQLVETRLLMLKSGHWNAGTYRWNKTQTEAFYTKEVITVPVNWKDENGQLRKVTYHIPGQKECVSCHQSADEIIPIGPKAMNLNRMVHRDNKQLNQLVYLQEKGLLELKTNLLKLSAMPAFKDTSISLESRARAYLAINCAHCHNSNGLASHRSLTLNYNVQLIQTGIQFNKSNIIERMSSLGLYHMPKLGTTVIDEEGVKLVRDYIFKLSKIH
ncbi:hypothetical protein H7F33_07250 [Pedobacter sp. PAMC26386]|nr:hypothetical protein H7F33_07250 [Pedobacter sp. PAMC26386]